VADPWARPTVRRLEWTGARAWAGPLGALGAAYSVANGWTVYETTAESVLEEQYCTGSECDWYLIFLTWTNLVCVPVTYTRAAIEQRFSFVGPYVNDPHGLRCWGAWELEAGPATAHAWFGYEQVAGPVDATGLPTTRTEPRGWYILGHGVAPGGATLLPPYGGAAAETSLLTMACDADGQLAVWAQVPGDRIARWRPGSGWQVRLAGTTLQALSREGADALALTTAGDPVFTLDGGETWAACPPIPATVAERRGQAPRYSDLFFVDEIA
jgi:hypothetical protein